MKRVDILGYKCLNSWWIVNVNRIYQNSGLHREIILVMGPGKKLLTWVGSGQTFMVWDLILKISLKNVKNNCFGSGQKVPGSKPGQPLIYCGSKVSSGWVGSGPISR